MPAAAGIIAGNVFLDNNLDTVRDAGKWDGPLGVLTAIACVQSLNQGRFELPFALQVIEVEGDKIVALHHFLDPNLFPEFGLPTHLDD